VIQELFSSSIMPFSLDNHWYREVKRRAPIPIVLGPQSTAVRLDNGAADGKPHAEALTFGGIKRLENLIQFIGG
jgi:hypothetical protein